MLHYELLHHGVEDRELIVYLKRGGRRFRGVEGLVAFHRDHAGELPVRLVRNAIGRPFSKHGNPTSLVEVRNLILSQRILKQDFSFVCVTKSWTVRFESRKETDTYV